MRNRSLILLGVAVTCGLIASVGVTRTLSQRATGAAPGTVEFTSIVVAAQDIPMGDLITADMVRTEPWPKQKVPSGAHRDLQNVVGRRPKTRIYAGTPILENQLLGRGEGAVDPTEHIPPGYRVVSVQVDEVIGAGRLIRPGDRVDLLVFIQRNLQRGIPETVTRTVLQDVKVFAVGDQFDLQETENRRSIAARSVSLLVTPRQAEILMLASELGTIRLSLRSHADDSVLELPGSNPRDLGAVVSDYAQLQKTILPPLTNPLPSAAGTPEPGNGEGLPDGERWNVRIIEGNQVRHLKLVSVAGHDSPTTGGASAIEHNPQLAWRVEEEDAYRPAGLAPPPGHRDFTVPSVNDHSAAVDHQMAPLPPTVVDDGPPLSDFGAL